MAWRLFPLIRATPTWSRWEHQVPWLTGMLSIQLLKFGIALLTITALFVLMRRRRSFFLVRGNLDALGDPVPWLGLRHPVSWNILGPVVAVVAAGIMIVVLGLTNHYRVATVLAAAPLLPAAVLLSLTNAFNEEVSYRCSLLAPLYEVVGKTHAMVLTAVFFGLAHYSGGVPLAVIPSVLMTGFLGWFMGKSMLETKGFFWAWFIHSVNDIPVFATLAMVAVMAARQAG
jgi:membrane protease YdiL (CAAX protease family)